jgi:hypothetical protein
VWPPFVAPAPGVSDSMFGDKAGRGPEGPLGKAMPSTETPGVLHSQIAKHAIEPTGIRILDHTRTASTLVPDDDRGRCRLTDEVMKW